MHRVYTLAYQRFKMAPTKRQKNIHLGGRTRTPGAHNLEITTKLGYDLVYHIVDLLLTVVYY